MGGGRQSAAAADMQDVFMQICRDLFREQSFVYNQVASFDDFIGSAQGIRNILENLFRISNIVQLEGGKTTEVGGKRYPVGSIELDVRFANVTVKQNNVETEEIHDLSVENEQTNR